MKNLKVKYPFEISFLDYPSPEGWAVMLYIPGCEHNCKNCHSPDLQDFNYSYNIKNFNMDELIREIRLTCLRNNTDKIVLTGGDPLHPKHLQNVKYLLELLYKYKFKICIYTGYDINYIKEQDIKYFEFIKCGKYIENLKQKSEKTDNKFTLASKNQKIYNTQLQELTIDGIYYFNN